MLRSRVVVARDGRGRVLLVLLVALAAVGVTMAMRLVLGRAAVVAAHQAAACPNTGGRARVPQRSSARRLVVGLDSLLDRRCDLHSLAAAGIRHTRIELAWSEVEPQPGHWRFGYYDHWIGDLARAKITVLPVLMDDPRWAERSPRTLPAHPAGYANFVAHVVKRYGPRGAFWRSHRRLPYRPIRWFELWNEPYFSQFSSGNPDASRYARLVRAATVAGRKANQGARFLLAADLVAQYPDGAEPPWVRRLYAAVPNLNRYFDGVAVHPYSFTESPTHFTPQGSTLGQFRRVEQLHRQFSARGGGRKPFWITEVGWATCPSGTGALCVTVAQQATYIRQMFQIVTTDYAPWVRAVFVYNYRDMAPLAPADKEDWFGMFYLDGRPKPSWGVLKAVAAGGAPG